VRLPTPEFHRTAKHLRAKKKPRKPKGPEARPSGEGLPNHGSGDHYRHKDQQPASSQKLRDDVEQVVRHAQRRIRPVSASSKSSTCRLKGCSSGLVRADINDDLPDLLAFQAEAMRRAENAS
jgi:hypothetical protein